MASPTKSDAARDAASLLAETWPGLIPIDPVFIARALGVRVVEADLSDNILGALVRQPGEDPTIMLNEKDSPSRRRFTCAHELGHYRRRSGEAPPYTTVDLRSGLAAAETNPEEIYADEFAACLLMPEEEVRRFAKEGLDDFAMAIRFAVSDEAVRSRLGSLGLSSLSSA